MLSLHIAKNWHCVTYIFHQSRYYVPKNAGIGLIRILPVNHDNQKIVTVQIYAVLTIKCHLTATITKPTIPKTNDSAKDNSMNLIFKQKEQLHQN